MGWTKVADLKAEPQHNLPEGFTLWTRHGLEGVMVGYGGQWAEVPREVILELVGQELIDREIAKLEQMDPKDAVNLLLR